MDLDDIQGLLRHGYPYFNAAAYRMLEIEDRAATRGWLLELLRGNWIDSARVRAEQLQRKEDKQGRAVDPQERCGVAIAFTPSGLTKLGLSADAMRTFVSEFQEGIAAPHRSRMLGDVDKNCPTRWRWGGPQDRGRIDILLMVFAAEHELEARLRDLYAIPGHPPVVHDLRGKRGDTEPFGFADGISQPLVEGLDFKPAGLTRERHIKAGEFVLGYPDEFGQHPAAPSVARDEDPRRILRFAENGRADLGRNGTFLVLRQLQQDVTAFEALTRQNKLLAARIVGRWPDGSALVQYPDENPSQHLPPGHRRNRAQLVAENDFGYRRDDPHGFRCPLGAHIRRANPRDSLAGNGIDGKTAQSMVNRHRLLRRGRVYEDKRTGEKGTLFLCLNANLERQFEFVQSTWAMNMEFHGLRAEADPLLGAGGRGASRALTIQRPWRNESCSIGLEQFVTVKGGGYFFLPGLNAIRYLASGQD